jgi:hypothetical protein
MGIWDIHVYDLEVSRCIFGWVGLLSLFLHIEEDKLTNQIVKDESRSLNISQCEIYYNLIL